MRRMYALVGATIGGWLGWYLGAVASIGAAFLISMVGTGVGMYVGIRFARHLS